MIEQVYKTCIEMLDQRGYSTIDHNDDDTSSLFMATNSDDNKISVIFIGDIKLTVQHIRQYLGEMDLINCPHCIIIYGNSVTPAARKFAHDNDDKKVELFSESELMYNITKHNYVPKHTRLSSNEAKEFKDRYGTGFPCLYFTDPVARFYDFSRGDVIEIEDLDEIIKYRIVK